VCKVKKIFDTRKERKIFYGMLTKELEEIKPKVIDIFLLLPSQYVAERTRIIIIGLICKQHLQRPFRKAISILFAAIIRLKPTFVVQH
jgi:hypothetical protein